MTEELNVDVAIKGISQPKRRTNLRWILVLLVLVVLLVIIGVSVGFGLRAKSHAQSRREFKRWKRF